MIKNLKKLACFVLVVTTFTIFCGCKNNNKKDSTNVDNNYSMIDYDLQNLINNGQCANALYVTKDGKVMYNKGFGVTRKYQNTDGDVYNNHEVKNYEGLKTKIITDSDSEDTLWDMASVTKVMSTCLALQHLLYENTDNKLNDSSYLNLDSLVSTYLPAYKDATVDGSLLENKITGKDKTKVRDLLTHTAGNVPDPMYFNDTYLKSEEARKLFGYKTVNTAYDQLYYCMTNEQSDSGKIDRTDIIDKICKTPLIYTPNTMQKYSDVDFMLLGLIIEKITGENQDVYVKREIYDKLNLKRTMYNPLQNGIPQEEIAATEVNGNTRDGYRAKFTNIRTYTLQGQVHDEKAYYCMGGVSGHAGLFSTPKELTILLQLMLNKGTYNGVTLFDEKITNEFLTPCNKINKEGANIGYRTNSYGLGWYVNDIDYISGGAGWGTYFSHYGSLQTFGHEGWTGPIVFADPKYDMTAVFMMNRPHSPVVPTSPNSFVYSGKGSQTYGMVSNHIYKDILKINELVSTLPNFDVIPSEKYGIGSKVQVKFLDPVLNETSGKMNGRVVKCFRVDKNTQAPYAPTDGNWIYGSIDLDYDMDNQCYYFQANKSGDYYISIYDDYSGGKVIKWITI